jgi:hypothetical protein
MSQLNIKDSETIRRVGELARREGLSKTAAVRLAVDETLARRAGQWEERMALLDKIVESYKVDGKTTLPSNDEIDAMLYDDDGLPR